MASCCRTELIRTFPLATGRLVTLILRDQINCEDPYMSLVRAQALSLRTGESFDSNRISRGIRDALIRTNVSI